LIDEIGEKGVGSKDLEKQMRTKTGSDSKRNSSILPGSSVE